MIYNQSSEELLETSSLQKTFIGRQDYRVVTK